MFKTIHYGEWDCTALFCEMLSLNTYVVTLCLLCTCVFITQMWGRTADMNFGSKMTLVRETFFFSYFSFVGYYPSQRWYFIYLNKI